MVERGGAGHTGVNTQWVIHRSSDLFPTVESPVDNSVDSLGQSCFPGCFRGCFPKGFRGHFHCVETPKPAAMKPNPTTMFQLPSESIGMDPSVT